MKNETVRQIQKKGSLNKNEAAMQIHLHQSPTNLSLWKSIPLRIKRSQGRFQLETQRSTIHIAANCLKRTMNNPKLQSN